jgi:hypothetical protein
MENLREELERFSLLSGYNSKLTLTENKTILINEQGFFAKFLTTFSDDAIKLLARDIESFSSVSKYGKDSETFLKDLRSGSKAAKGLVGEFVKDILKSDKILQSNRGLYDQAIDAYTRQLAGSSESFAKQFKNASKADKATMLRNAKYPERAINRIIKKTEEFAGVGAKEAEVVAKDFESLNNVLILTEGDTFVASVDKGGLSFIDRYINDISIYSSLEKMYKKFANRII